MPAEDEHVAHPRLYGAPAYARPPLKVTPTVLPPDPDDLPIAVQQTTQERAIAGRLLTNPYGVAEPPTIARLEPRPRSQPLLLRVLAVRVLRRAS
jgi:hypothetical protein